MKRFIPIAAIAAAIFLTSTSSYAQALIGGGGGGGIGDPLVQYFYQNFMHAIAAAGLLAMLIGALVMRSHLMYFMVGGIALLCIGNYTTILGLFNL